METKNISGTKTGATAAEFIDKDTRGVAIFNLSVLIVPDGDFWFAQGIEINYGAQGDSVEDAKFNFQEGLFATICQHLRVYGNIDKMLKAAPSGILKEATQNKSSMVRYAQVSFHDIAEINVQEALRPWGGIDFGVIRQAA